MIKFVHVVVGSIALIAGAIAYYAAKGSAWHKRAGLWFTGSMVLMSATGVVLSIFRHERGSLLAGALTLYLVASGTITVRRQWSQPRTIALGAVYIGVVTIAGLVWAWMAMQSGRGRLDSLPTGVFVGFSLVAILALLGDLRLLAGHLLSPPARLQRHLWRLGTAMWVATSSLFFGNPRLFPEVLRATGLLSTPIWIVFALTAYWFLKLGWQRWRTGSSARARSARAAPAVGPQPPSEPLQVNPRSA